MKQYKPMTLEDSTFAVDFAKYKDHSTAAVFKVVPKKKRWFWPFKSREEKHFELVVQSFLDINSDDLYKKFSDEFRKRYIYGDISEEKTNERSRL